jgi:hypothetical protein
MGFGDITLGIKEQLRPLPKEFDLSVILAVSLPIGASRVSSHGYDPLLSFHGLKSSKEVGPPGVCRTCFLTRMAASGTPFGSPRSTSRGKSRNRGRLSPSTQVTSRSAAGQRRSLTLEPRTGSPRGNRWIFTSGSAYLARRRAISLQWVIRSASIGYGAAHVIGKPKHQLRNENRDDARIDPQCRLEDSERSQNVTPRFELANGDEWHSSSSEQ